MISAPRVASEAVDDPPEPSWLPAPPARTGDARPGTRGPSDADLIGESLLAPERFGLVFDRHAVAIHGYLARRLGRDAADDLVADTFLVAFRKREGYRAGQPSALPWLYGIATRLVSRHQRDEVRFFRAIARTGIDPAAASASAGDAVAEEAISRADAQAAQRLLAASLASLPKADRDALLLIAEGLKYEEAALALGIPPGTFSSRLARARKSLRTALQAAESESAND